MVKLESFSKMTTVTEEVLRIIGANRVWTRNYGVALGLTRNPKTPTGVALQFASAGGLVYQRALAEGKCKTLPSELFKLKTGIDMVHIPYKGSTPAYIDLMAGQVDMYFGVMAGALPHINSRRVRAYARSASVERSVSRSWVRVIPGGGGTGGVVGSTCGCGTASVRETTWMVRSGRSAALAVTMSSCGACGLACSAFKVASRSAITLNAGDARS